MFVRHLFVRGLAHRRPGRKFRRGAARPANASARPLRHRHGAELPVARNASAPTPD
jgi:hypothetical protein